MNFEEYLQSKKIDVAAFRAGDPDTWRQWQSLFDEISPASFTAQKLYLINPIRRKYKLAPVPEDQKPMAAPKSKPVFKPKLS